MLEVGAVAPEFEVPGAGSDGIELYRLADYLGVGAAVLVFYPFAFSPVCTTQLCRFRDAEWLAVNENVDVLGIAVDSAYAQQRFREAYDLSFPLLTDRLAEVAADYGVRYDEWEHHPAVAKRAVVTVDADQTVRYTWSTDDATESPTDDELQESIAWLE